MLGYLPPLGTTTTAVESIKEQLNAMVSTYPLSSVYVGTALCMCAHKGCACLWGSTHVHSIGLLRFFSKQNIT